MKPHHSSAVAYGNEDFCRRIDEALQHVIKILDETRTPKRAADVDHSYNDKFGLAEFLTNTAIAAELNVLERFGLNRPSLTRLADLSEGGKRSITLRFENEESCTFVKELEVDVPATCEHRIERSGTETESLRSTVITKVKEFHWKFGVEYSFYAFAGTNPDVNKIILRGRCSTTDIVTTGNKKSPRPRRVVHKPIDVNLSWILRNLILQQGGMDQAVCSFSIDRSQKSCRTPRRNEDIEGAVKFFRMCEKWCEQVRLHFVNLQNTLRAYDNATHPSGTPEAREDLSFVNAKNIFIPVLPLFEEQRLTVDDEKEASSWSNMLVSIPMQSGETQGPLLSVGDVNKFLKEQCRTMDEKISTLNSSFPSEEENKKVISSAEAVIMALAQHGLYVGQSFQSSIGYIEDMLRTQLVTAIGKKVVPKDFSDYMRFHNQNLFLPQFVPNPFCYTIRRPNHYPEGTLSIMQRIGSTEESQTIETITRKLEPGSPMTFAINAATSVEFTGERYVHAWVGHTFGNDGYNRQDRLQLVARARQFSSFLLLIGKISGAEKFDPQHAIILQNKDELLIPLLLEQLPTPKEFKDAIESLSPEQKRFAIAFRNMQLESSVFGLCVVQLKPQLEALLGLPVDALTKEIRLTQDLLELFIKYQIPSDLLTYSGDDGASVMDKVAAVKNHVLAVQGMIADAKEKELGDAEKESDMRMELAAPQTMQFLRGGPQAPLARTARDDRCRIAAGPMQEPPRRRTLQAKRAEARMQEPPARSANIAFASASYQPATKAIGRGQYEASDEFSVSGTVSSVDTSGHENACDSGRGTMDFTIIPSGRDTMDFTMIPRQLDAQFEALDDDAAIRPTMIKVGHQWEKKFQKNLLTKTKSCNMREEEQTSAKDEAFDLLDALSKSGALPIASAELHVMVAATHCFDKSLIDTAIVDNVNPIERMERSMLIVASTIHGKGATSLLKEDQVERVACFSPMLLTAAKGDDTIDEDMVDTEV